MVASALEGPNAIDSDLAGVDAGDTVRFAAVVENTGSSPKGAYDVALRRWPRAASTPAASTTCR